MALYRPEDVFEPQICPRNYKHPAGGGLGIFFEFHCEAGDGGELLETEIQRHQETFFGEAMSALTESRYSASTSMVVSMPKPSFFSASVTAYTVSAKGFSSSFVNP